MPFAQLVTSGIETVINKLLNLDSESQARLQKLSGRSLQVSVTEFPWPLLFSFSDQVDVRAVMESSASESIDPTPDCLIALDLETLPKLQDSSQLTQLIQQKKLNLIGDIYVAQTFSTLIKDLDIDWEEQLSNYTGDVVAHQTFTSVKSIFKQVKQSLNQSAEKVAANLRQTNSIAVSQNEVILFCEDISDLRSSTERLTARIALLEKAADKTPEQNSSKESQNQ